MKNLFSFFLTKLSFIKLNEGLLIIGDKSFIASTLEEITIPSTVTNIHINAFYNSNLKTINIKAPKDSIEGSPCGSSATINWIE